MLSFISPDRLAAITLIVLGTVSASWAQTSQIPFTAVPPSATTIAFETTPLGAAVPIGTSARNVWASLGVTFDDNDAVSGPFTLRSPPNVLNPGPNTTSAIRAAFDPHLSVVGAWGFDFVMEAYDQFGASLGAITHTDGSAGLFGGAAEFGFLGVMSTTPIARVEFRHAFPNNQAFGFHIDDLAFVQGPPPPPRQLIAYTEFNEPPLAAGSYAPSATGEELGFTTVASPTAGINPLAGVAALDGGERVLSHRSTNATTTFDNVDLADYDDVNVFVRLQVANTGYEADDSLRVFVTNGSETINLLNAIGAAPLNDLAGDGFLSYGANIPNSWTQVALVMTSSSNSSQAAERYDIDGIEFHGVFVIPEPSSAAVAFVALFTLGAIHVRRRVAHVK